MANTAYLDRSIAAQKSLFGQIFGRVEVAIAAFIQSGSWPLIGRDLRGMARQSQIYWIRVIGAGLGIATIGMLLLREVEVGASLGSWIFQILNGMVSFTILLAGPVITADCIALEKREGTLGLLFLAPLTARDIVLAKAVANAVRAVTLLLAVLPLMALPVVLGGVPTAALVFAIAGHIGSLCIALSAGILASTLHREFIQAAVCAVLYCLGFLILSHLIGRISWPLISFLMANGAGAFALILSQLVFFATAAFVTWLVFNFASVNLKERWEKESENFKPPFWVRLFSDSELWRALLKWDTRKARSRHPIAWLQEYSWTARLAKWGWCALALAAEFLIIAYALVSRHNQWTHFALAAAVVLGIALSGANSFRSERLSGAIELLLVAPLSPLKIIGGRLWGIWVHFFPAVAIISFLWIAGASLFRVRASSAGLLISSYIFLPMIGLYISMLPWNILVAWAVIYLVGAVLPCSVAFALRNDPPVVQLVLVIAIQALLGITALLGLRRMLVTRSFTFQKYS